MIYTYGVNRCDENADVAVHKDMTEVAALKAIETYNKTAEVAGNGYVYVLAINSKPTA